MTLRKMREDRGLSLTAASRAAGIAPSTLCHAEAGKLLGTAALVKVAEALGDTALLTAIKPYLPETNRKA